ncbi:transposase [Streptococcus danieliae]|nr:transposase [Streptococcus danieliae]
MMSKRPRRTFSKEFKSQIVALIENGKPRTEVFTEYDLNPSTGVCQEFHTIYYNSDFDFC